MRQEVTRAHKGWALDSVTLHNEVIKAVKEDISAPPVVCCQTYYFGLKKFVHLISIFLVVCLVTIAMDFIFYVISFYLKGITIRGKYSLRPFQEEGGWYNHYDKKKLKRC